MEATMEERLTAAQLKDWRKGYGWTQEQAAARLGLNIDHYRKREQGKRSVSQRDMRLIVVVKREKRAVGTCSGTVMVVAERLPCRIFGLR
jgi:DNA-binding transcriptional regulator YiaG